MTVISASRRTDIPAFYTDWFLNCIKKGYVTVNNRTTSLKPQDVDCIVFWTKNPEKLLKRIDELKDYKFYFQFTLNAYEKDIEPNVPDKSEVVKTFKQLSDKIGKDKVIWRYDPIFLNHKYTKEYHYKHFELLCKELHKYTNKCIFSYIDMYGHCIKSMADENVQPLTLRDQIEIAIELSQIAEKYNIKLETCAEKINLEELNIGHAHCIDGDLIEKITGKNLNLKKDPAQRMLCGCVASIDIGTYETCKHNCKYCYANKYGVGK